MRFTWDKDSRTLALGAALALAGGVLLGGAMRPDLSDDGRPAGPQMIAGWSGVRSTGPFDPGMTYASYSGQVPDYVLGSDWKKAMAAASEAAAVSPPARRVAASEETPAAEEPADWAAPVTRAAYDDPPPEPVRYPSLGGGLAADAPQPDDPPAIPG